jgi:nucleoid-associated protein YgaU
LFKNPNNRKEFAMKYNVFCIVFFLIFVVGGQNLQASVIGVSYAVKEREILWNIARENYGEGSVYTVLAKVNMLKNPDMIKAGSVLILPDTVKLKMGKKQKVFHRSNEVERALFGD